MGLTIVIIAFCYIQRILCFNSALCKFPEDFSFGVGTSAYQIEGAWNATGKGYSYFDYITHETKAIEDGSTGDVACDSYHKTDVDVALLKRLGVNHYRFSIAWTRIYPTGLINNISWDGVSYYDNLINKLLDAGIKPWVTIYHWDHPYGIQELGGWFQPKIADYIADYADLLFKLYGDRVKTWITLNEPYSICVNLLNYRRYMPKGFAEYMCGQNMLRAHAAIWKVYQKYRSTQKGKLSMAFNLQAHLPATDSPADIEAAERLNQFAFGWFVNPVVHGNYPKVMIDTIASYSKKQGFKESRLPPLSPEDLDALKGSCDFIGLNTYDFYLVSSNNGSVDVNPSYANDYGAKLIEPNWNVSYTIHMKAKGLGVVLNWIKNTYNNPEICITEQGYWEDARNLFDSERSSYILANMAQMLQSIHKDKVNLTAYSYWSFMDNFEWNKGYLRKYGLLDVNFNDPNRKRRFKLSAKTFSTVAFTRKLT
nr:glycoside hydrolase family 1 [Phyllotreta armoraciae]